MLGVSKDLAVPAGDGSRIAPEWHSPYSGRL